MPVTIRKGLILLVVAFLVFSLVSQPEDSAQFVRDVGSAIQDAFGAIIDFFETLSS